MVGCVNRAEHERGDGVKNESHDAKQDGKLSGEGDDSVQHVSDQVARLFERLLRPMRQPLSSAGA